MPITEVRGGLWEEQVVAMLHEMLIGLQVKMSSRQVWARDISGSGWHSDVLESHRTETGVWEKSPRPGAGK